MEIRRVLKTSKFMGEGHRKVTFRLRGKGIRVGRKRVLRLIRSTASYVGEPEGNGVAERFIRTMKEECLYLHDVQSPEAARGVIGESIERYNREWLLERYGYRTPAEAGRDLTRKAA